MVNVMKDKKVEALKNRFIDEFIACLHEDKLIWEKGWKIILHKNLVSNIDYKGYNQLLLMYISYCKNLSESLWLTFNQAQNKNMKIKKGAKSVPIQYFSYYDLDSKKTITLSEYQEAVENNRKDRIQIVQRHYNIFNVDDIEGYESDVDIKKNNILALDKYIEKSCLKIQFVGNQPCYIPSEHKIIMPPQKQFKNDDEYYSTLLHELSHSTMKHIDREFPVGVDTQKEKYAFEELIAEISSVLLCCEFGVQLKSIQNNKAYIQGWIAKMSDNKEAYLMKSIKNANNVTQYIIDNIA